MTASAFYALICIFFSKDMELLFNGIIVLRVTVVLVDSGRTFNIIVVCRTLLSMR